MQHITHNVLCHGNVDLQKNDFLSFDRQVTTLSSIGWKQAFAWRLFAAASCQNS